MNRNKLQRHTEHAAELSKRYRYAVVAEHFSGLDWHPVDFAATRDKARELKRQHQHTVRYGHGSEYELTVLDRSYQPARIVR